MAKDLKKFTKKKFLHAVPMELFLEFLKPFVEDISLDMERLSPDSVLDFLLNMDENYPPKMVEDLHRMCDLSDPTGFDILTRLYQEKGIEIVPRKETGEYEAVSPQHLALLSYVKHPDIFEDAHDMVYYFHITNPAEYAGIDEREVEVSDTKKQNLEAALANYFHDRYKGRYCRVKFFSDGGDICATISHGKHLTTGTFLIKDKEQPLSYRDIKQGMLAYNPDTGRLKANASSIEEREKLAGLFAEHIIGDKDFFNHEKSQDIYTLEAFQKQWPEFKFNYKWDEEVTGVRITEIQLFSKSKKAWKFMLKDYDVLLALHEYRNVNLRTAAINYIKIRFDIMDGVKKTSRTVKLKPPSMAQFDRRKFENKIMEHLKRNGFVKDTKPVAIFTPADRPRASLSV